MKFISLEQALGISGHGSKPALYFFVRRFNQRNPKHKILRRRGAIELQSLQRALALACIGSVPGLTEREALSISDRERFEESSNE